MLLNASLIFYCYVSYFLPPKCDIYDHAFIRLCFTLALLSKVGRSLFRFRFLKYCHDKSSGLWLINWMVTVTSQRSEIHSGNWKYFKNYEIYEIYFYLTWKLLLALELFQFCSESFVIHENGIMDFKQLKRFSKFMRSRTG